MKRQRSGYTLMEIIVVVAIILVVMTLAVPAAMTWLADARADAAADMVRARLTDARSKAMEDGRPWRLAYLANTGYFQLAPEESMEWEAVQQSNTKQTDVIRDELPKDILFVASPDDLVGKREAGTVGNMWETIAIYMPNGSARDDSLTYFGKVGVAPARARLRALTGSITIELPRDIQAATP
ncbi:MAG: prepilin-type N-terminal cleavage/methylation domain-containing protein [Gemmataceae bacterium]|nr:prepilin-type N-terminal cleavage/methylation domain-containing protein [Gemmataceae bacterium]